MWICCSSRSRSSSFDLVNRGLVSFRVSFSFNMKNSLFVVDIIDYHAALCPPVTDSQTVYDIGDLGNFGAGEMQAPFEAAVLKLQV